MCALSDLNVIVCAPLPRSITLQPPVVLLRSYDHLDVCTPLTVIDQRGGPAALSAGSFDSLIWSTYGEAGNGGGVPGPVTVKRRGTSSGSPPEGVTSATRLPTSATPLGVAAETARCTFAGTATLIATCLPAGSLRLIDSGSIAECGSCSTPPRVLYGRTLSSLSLSVHACAQRAVSCSASSAGDGLACATLSSTTGAAPADAGSAAGTAADVASSSATPAGIFVDMARDGRRRGSAPASGGSRAPGAGASGFSPAF